MSMLYLKLSASRRGWAPVLFNTHKGFQPNQTCLCVKDGNSPGWQRMRFPVNWPRTAQPRGSRASRW